MMDPSHPTSPSAQAEIEAEATRAASAPLLKTKTDQTNYLLHDTQSIERSLASLVKNQECLERIMESKFHALDIKLTKPTTIVDSKEVDEAKLSSNDDGTTLSTTTKFTTMPRSCAVPVPEMGAKISTPAATTNVAPPAPQVSTPPD
ncbi:hypothetical protein D1007_11803 [Hordeum vulgare]|nr:hypothetical protein D1007_11803 [Hordeum vulgare]